MKIGAACFTTCGVTGKDVGSVVAGVVTPSAVAGGTAAAARGAGARGTAEVASAAA